MLVFFPPAVFHTEKVKSYSSLFGERGLGFKHLSIQSERFSVLWRWSNTFACHWGACLIRNSILQQSHGICLLSRIIKLFRPEKAFKITEFNNQPDLLSPVTKPCPLVPHPHLRDGTHTSETPPSLPWAAYSNAWPLSLKKFFLKLNLNLPWCNLTVTSHTITFHLRKDTDTLLNASSLLVFLISLVL